MVRVSWRVDWKGIVGEVVLGVVIVLLLTTSHPWWAWLAIVAGMVLARVALHRVRIRLRR